MQALEFIKMEGLGNDYVYLNGFQPLPENLPELARRLSDRHFGVGSDGLIAVLPSERGDARMLMFNADGSRAEMCGNGIRCVAKLAVAFGIASGPELLIETDAGPKHVRIGPGPLDDARVTVDMGSPELERSAVPFAVAGSGPALEAPLEVDGRTFRVTAVSMGNPHGVIHVEDPTAIEVERWGPLLERHAAFPSRANIEFVGVESPEEIRIRVWERGSGETLACGTGACAAVVAGAITGKHGRSMRVRLPGGVLEVDWDGGNDHILMTGPARRVFRGVVEL